MFTLKPIHEDSIDSALAKAERYRLLNEPQEAESICRDILDIDPTNREARVSLILALTDELPDNPAAFTQAIEAIPVLESSYDRAYYSGIAWERRAKAGISAGGPGSSNYIYDWVVKALRLFEEAERVRPAGNDDAILRWNACVRFLQSHKDLGPKTEDEPEPILSE
jgi:hypothetical protein